MPAAPRGGWPWGDLVTRDDRLVPRIHGLPPPPGAHFDSRAPWLVLASHTPQIAAHTCGKRPPRVAGPAPHAGERQRCRRAWATVKGATFRMHQRRGAAGLAGGARAPTRHRPRAHQMLLRLLALAALVASASGG